MVMTMKKATVSQKMRQDLEIAEDLYSNGLEDLKRKRRPGYLKFINSPQYRLDQFLDSLDAERRSWR